MKSWLLSRNFSKARELWWYAVCKPTQLLNIKIERQRQIFLKSKPMYFPLCCSCPLWVLPSSCPWFQSTMLCGTAPQEGAKMKILPPRSSQFWMGALCPSCSLDSPWATFKSLDVCTIPQMLYKTPQMISMCNQDENKWSVRSWPIHECTDPMRDNTYSITTIHCLVSSNCFLALNGSLAYGSLCMDDVRI